MFLFTEGRTWMVFSRPLTGQRVTVQTGLSLRPMCAWVALLTQALFTFFEADLRIGQCAVLQLRDIFSEREGL